MGKTPKKAAPGGDERNLYVRRKKTTTAKAKSSNRSNLNSIQKKIPTAQGKNLKVKPSVLTKVGLSQPQVSKPRVYPPKEKKLSTFLLKDIEESTSTMQPESEESEVKLKISIQKDSNEQTSVQEDTEETVAAKERVDHALKDSSKVEVEPKDGSRMISQKEQGKLHEEKNGTEHSNANPAREIEECEESDLKLSFDADDSPVKPAEERLNDKDFHGVSKTIAEQVPQQEMKNGLYDKEESHSVSHTDAESCPSIDIAESTTSELSETGKVMPPTDVALEKKKAGETATKDMPNVTYDSSILLKDVQIKLNDCLKDNGKAADGSEEQNLDDSLEDIGSPSQFAKDVSFGKTLRGISGRQSVGRMRYVTLRERDRLSPNNSLFVNTSNISLQADDGADFKILRHSTGMSDTFSTNGTPAERKRKHDPEHGSSTKKSKTENENSLLHASSSLLKGLRRPVQVSTPNTDVRKLQPTKFNLSDLEIEDEEPKIITGPMDGGGKKWCVIM